MVALTWRNVDAPDFTGAAASQAIAGRSLNNAFSGLSESIKSFDNTQTDIVNRSIQAKLAAAQTPEDVAKLAPLITGGDPRRLSSETLTMFGQQPTTLIQRAATKRNFEWAGIDRQFSDEQKKLGLETAALLPSYQEAMGSNDPAKIAAFHKANPGFLHGMTLDSTQAVLAAGNASQDRFFTRRNGDLAYAKDTFAFDNLKENDAFQKQADAVIKQLRTSVVSNADFQRQVTALNLPPEVQARVLASAASVLPGASDFADMLPSAAPGMPGSTASMPRGNTNTNSPVNTVVGGGTVDMGNMTIGDIIKYGEQVSIPKTRGNSQLGLSVNKGSSAIGAYQITNDTWKDFGPKALGPNWASQNGSLENQDKVGRAIFDSTKGDVNALRNRWTSLKKLSDAEVKQLGQAGWEKARVVIARGESGATAADLTPSAQADSNITNSINSAFARNNPNNFAQVYGAAARTPMDQASATASLAGTVDENGNATGGALAGMPVSLIDEHLKTVMRMADKLGVKDMTWGIAAAVVKNSLGGNRWDRNAPNILGGNTASGGRTLDTEAAYAEVQKLAGGGLARAVSRNDELTQIEAGRGQVAAGYSAAYNRWQQAKYAHDVLGRTSVNVQAAYDEYMQWSNRYGAVQAELEGRSDLNQGNTPPAPAARPMAREFKFSGARGG